MAPCHFTKLHFIVKGHKLHPMAGCIFDLRDLFAGVGVDNLVRRDPDALN